MPAAETTTVRINTQTHRMLRDLAAARQQTLQEVVEEAAQALYREVFFSQLRDAVADLSEQDRAEERAQVEAWDTTLGDGLPKE